jgi:predicted RNA-binding protein YlxR (DUF448 family)
VSVTAPTTVVAQAAPTPQRTCIGCRRVRAPQEMTRLVRRADGGIDVGRHLPGRGAWLCADSPGCFERAVRRRAFDRTLRTTASTEAIAALRERLSGPSPSRPARVGGRGETTE